MKTTPRQNAAKSRRRSAPVADVVGPHGDDPPTRGAVDSCGAEGRAPLNFDDDEIYSGRGKVRSGGTTQAEGGDSGLLGPPPEQLAPTNSPSDRALRRGGGAR